MIIHLFLQYASRETGIMDGLSAPPNSYVGILLSNMTALGGRAFEKKFGHKSGAVMNPIGALIKKRPKSFLSLSLLFTM